MSSEAQLAALMERMQADAEVEFRQVMERLGSLLTRRVRLCGSCGR